MKERAATKILSGIIIGFVVLIIIFLFISGAQQSTIQTQVDAPDQAPELGPAPFTLATTSYPANGRDIRVIYEYMNENDHDCDLTLAILPSDDCSLTVSQVIPGFAAANDMGKASVVVTTGNPGMNTCTFQSICTGGPQDITGTLIEEIDLR